MHSWIPEPHIPTRLRTETLFLCSARELPAGRGSIRQEHLRVKQQSWPAQLRVLGSPPSSSAADGRQEGTGQNGRREQGEELPLQPTETSNRKTEKASDIP